MKIFTLFLLSLTFVLFSSGKTLASEITVESGADLQAAIDAAASGDILILADGGEYVSTASLTINGKDLTIKAADGAIVPPLLTIKEFTIDGTGNALELSGLKIDGGLNSYVIYFLETQDSTRSIYIHDCEIVNFARSLIRGDKTPSGSARMICDSIVVDNCVITNVGVDNGTYQTFLMKSAFKADYISITNSTFYNCDGGFFRDENTSEVKTIIIDHCTLNDVMKNTGKNLMISYGAEGSTLTISNSIITNLPDLTYWKLNIPVRNFSHIAYFGIANETLWSPGSAWTNVTEANLTDPGYANAANGDFTVSNEALYTADTDGKLVGDPRWSKNGPSAVIDVDNTKSGINIYPNPANDRVYFDVTQSTRIGLYSLAGNLLKQKLIESKSDFLNVGDLPQGMYYVRSLDNSNLAKKLIVQ